MKPGQTVLDIGCGAGMDLLLSAHRTGPEGRAIGVDPAFGDSDLSGPGSARMLTNVASG